MLHHTIDTEIAKGWLAGPWNSAVPIPVGYANQGIDEKHYHAQIYEIYLVARGTSVARVDDREISLRAGDMLIVEPNEVHTFTSSSADYLHFVIQAPFVSGDKTLVE